MALSDKFPKYPSRAVIVPVTDDSTPVMLAFLRDHYRYTHLKHFMTLDTLEKWVYGSTPHLIVDRGVLAAVAWWDQEDDFNLLEKVHLIVHKHRSKYLQAYMVLAISDRFLNPHSPQPEWQIIEVCKDLNPSLWELVDSNPATTRLPNCGNPIHSNITRTWYNTSIYAVTPVTLAQWLQGPPPRVEKTKATGTDSPKPAYRVWFDRLRQKFKNHKHAGRQ